ncbi:MAG: response regulator transcription factor [Candidatus Thiodiazotropha sp.]
MNNRLLLIEDDREVREMLGEYLRSEGFTVEQAADGQTGLDKALSQTPDLIILDVMLPRLDGFEVLRRLRATSPTPVLMLTARRDDIDRILGLELGADDYLPKPFNPRELVARIRAILRRVQNPVEPTQSTLTLARLTLSLTTRELTIDEQLVSLTLSEFNILHALLLNREKVISKQQLSLEALGRPLEIYDRSLDVHISHLRKKLKHAGVGIRTIRAVGYRIEVE